MMRAVLVSALAAPFSSLFGRSKIYRYQSPMQSKGFLGFCLVTKRLFFMFIYLFKRGFFVLKVGRAFV